MRIDALASTVHYLDHIAPIWNRIPEDARGDIFVADELLAHAGRTLVEGSSIRPEYDIRPSANPILVAGYSDLQNSPGRRHVLMEHGSGQSYEPFDQPAYAGGVARDSVELFLCPNDYSAELNRRRYPDAQIAVIGSPRLEHLMGLARESDGRTIAFGFHFDLMLCAETRNGWEHFSSAVRDAAASENWNVIGHAHPRIFRDLAPTYAEWGVEAVKDFDEVIRRADVYVADNSSTLFEFAATVGPVVVMNPPWYRTDVHHGLRFWDAADVGPQVTDPYAVLPAAKQALAGWPGKEAALDFVYPPVEDPAAVAAEVILKVLGMKKLRATPRPIPEFPRGHWTTKKEGEL